MADGALERLRVVAAAAAVDGAVTPAERAALHRVAAALGLESTAVDAVLAEPGRLTRPAPEEEEAVLGWLVEVSRVDGEVAPAEEQFVRRVAAAFGRTPEQVDAILARGVAGQVAAAETTAPTSAPAPAVPLQAPSAPATVPPAPATPASALGVFDGALAREGDVWVEQVDPALAASLHECARPGEALAAAPAVGPGVAALAPWSVDVGGRVVHAADPGAAAGLTLASVSSAAAAVAALHARGRVHGDLRPEALRVRADGAPVLAVPAAPLDAAAALRARVRAAGGDPRDVAYAAPEVVAGREATAAADVYAIGALAYRALTGEAPLGQVEWQPVPQGALALPPLLRRALGARPEQRPALGAVSTALARAAQAVAPAPERAPEPTDAFELVDGATEGALRARLVGAPADDVVELTDTDRAAPVAEGAQVSAILMLVLGLGGIFVLVGAIGLAIVLEQAGGPGLLGLLLLLTAGAFAGGGFAERRGSPRGGLVLTAVGTQLLWADAAYVLNVVRLLESSVAWCAVATGVAVVTGVTARRRGSTALWVLAGIGALIASACLWSAVGPGGRAFLLAASAAGVLVGGYTVRAGGREEVGLGLLHVGALLLLGVAAQVLNVMDRLDDEGAWAFAAGACAAVTAVIAVGARARGLWVICGLQGALASACLWAALDSTGRGALSGAAALALLAAGHVTIGRDRRSEGLALLLAGGLVAWVSGWHLLDGQGLESSKGAWVVTGAVITALAYAPALRHRSTLVATLGAVDLSITAVFLGDYLSRGTLHGPALYTGVVAAAFAGVAALTHLMGGVALAAPASVGAGLWAWASAGLGLAVAGQASDGVFWVGWPFALVGLACAATLVGPRDHRPIAAGAAFPLVALVPTIVAFVGAAEHEHVGYLQLALGASFLVIAAAFHSPTAAMTTTRQLLAILPALVPATLAPFVLCLAFCAGRDGMALLEEALATLGQLHETRFAYLASVVGSSGVLVGAAFLFAPRATSRAAYRLLEAAGLLLFFGTFTILSLSRMEDWFYPLVLLVGGAVVIGLGVWQRRAVLVASASVALLLNLWLQYFAKLHDRVPTFGLLLGFGLGLLGFGLLYERRVKRVLPVLREWA